MILLSASVQQKAAKKFVERWEGKGYEKGETQRFWLELLHALFGIENPMSMMEFELPVKTITKEKGSDFIDAYIPSTKVLIEQKSSHVELNTKFRQSDGSELTPYQQARRYAAGLPLSMAPRWIVACNFREFEVHDMERPNDAPEIIQLADLEKECHRLTFLVDDTSVHIKKELEVSMAAGRIIGEIYDAFLKEYRNPEDSHSLRSLNILCVRLVFCLYAEDAGLFSSHSQFHDYLVQFKAGTGEMRKGLLELFDVLNTPLEERDPYLPDDLLAFPYVNGGLFAEEGIEVPRFTETIANLLLQRASDDFDWSEISPTIFGGVFESTLNPETRRAGGMHYTSIENIHKVIDPLFLDDLKKELDEIKAVPVEKKRIAMAQAFQDKLASLTFLDPACGSGNFLTETFLSLRRLENEAIRIIYKGQMMIGEFVNPIKVSINQFYGIEINDFAVSVAMTALWIAEAQMLFETEKIMQINLDFLPLKSYSNIKEGNALRLDWSYWEKEDDSTVVLAELTHIYPVQATPKDTLQE
ncbi:MAG: methylase, partial [Bacteroidales bacterium]|nr:methylase [Bacteroidales bacterium]